MGLRSADRLRTKTAGRDYVAIRALAPLPTDTEASVLPFNSAALPSRQTHEILGLVRGQTVYAFCPDKDPSTTVRLVLGGEMYLLGRRKKVQSPTP